MASDTFTLRANDPASAYAARCYIAERTRLGLVQDNDPLIGDATVFALTAEGTAPKVVPPDRTSFFTTRHPDEPERKPVESTRRRGG